MRKLALLFLMLCATLHAWSLTPTQKLARAIAKAEGFGVKGAIPTRYHNPGDIRASRGVRYPGQIGLNKSGYVIFKNDKAGWAALEDQIDRIAAGQSRFYTVNDTLKQLAKKYATSPTWIRNVAHNLGVTSGTNLFEILDVPPVLTTRSNPHELDFILGGVQ
jgi:hypothetical protein